MYLQTDKGNYRGRFAPKNVNQQSVNLTSIANSYFLCDESARKNNDFNVEHVLNYYKSFRMSRLKLYCHDFRHQAN